MRRSNNRIDPKFYIRYECCDELSENIRMLIYSMYHIFDHHLVDPNGVEKFEMR